MKKRMMLFAAGTVIFVSTAQNTFAEEETGGIRKIALITGASYGIGMAIAKGMAAAGATIVFNDIKQELVDKGLAAYEEAGIKAHGYVCDVTNEDAVNELVAKIEAEVGVIDILVNNAGIIKRIPMCEMTAAQFRQVIDVD